MDNSTDKSRSSGSASTRSAGSRARPRSRWAPTPSARRSATPASTGTTSSSPSAAATRSTTPTRVVTYLGPTGIPFTNVYNGCATAASSLDMAAKMISLGAYDLGLAVGMDKHPTGRFTADPVEYALPAWYGETGPS